MRTAFPILDFAPNGEKTKVWIKKKIKNCDHLLDYNFDGKSVNRIDQGDLRPMDGR